MSAPPPPPPHGEMPRSGGLPPGKYDIFVIPEHSAGSGFLYLPSLQPNINSFVAGFASALILVALCQSMAPAFRAWWDSFQGLGNMGITLLIVGVGFGAWALGRTQNDSGSSSSSKPNPSSPPPPNSGPSAGPAPGGYASTPPPNEAPPPPPPNAGPEKPQSSWQRPPPQTGNKRPENPKPSAKGSWEKARDEMRKKEEERKAKEAEQKRRDDLAKRLAELRAKEAKERLEREKEKQRKEKEIADKKEKEAKAAEAKAAAAKAAEAKTAAEKAKAAAPAPSQAPTQTPSPTANRAGSSYAYSGVGEKMSMWPNGKPPAPSSPTPKAPPSPPKKPPAPTARTFVSTDEDAFSYRPYDKPRRPQRRNSGGSMASDGSWAPSHTTARTSPPPSMRGPYTTKDPDKIVIQAVYLFMNQYAKTPASQLISGVGSVTDGLILRITTEGLFIDDDVRGVPQREWDVKAWTLKLVESGEWKARGLHLLRATVRDQDGKRYLFVIDETEHWKVGASLQRLRRGAQARQLGVCSMTASEAKNSLETLGWAA
ncbi:uncharacterized protein LMH87_008958 [Akanthomyces muscarius]|uniref:Proline-rich protein RiP-15 n=1 Tax=Akanthomyces muscarius TaxID=2231603 RepID=A0A9W8QK82_AKAMU|nr:uncharacterized protein LMH87_008958 [Akanthomyces muscarius]KAJ4158432.1 hypothetical protein LMH87_008958 [Akanthomyces muscarius]